MKDWLARLGERSRSLRLRGLGHLRPGVCSVLPSAGRIQSSSNTPGVLRVNATPPALVSLSGGNGQPDPNLVQAETRRSVVQQEALA